MQRIAVTPQSKLARDRTHGKPRTHSRVGRLFGFAGACTCCYPPRDVKKDHRKRSRATAQAEIRQEIL